MKKYLLYPIGNMLKHMIYSIILLSAFSLDLLADEINAPSIEQVKVSVRFENTPLKKAFSIIEQKTSFKFAYTSNRIPLDKKVSLQADDQSVAEVLNKIFAHTNLIYKQSNQNILISERSESLPKDRLLRGKVSDAANGEPLPGVNVLATSTNIGTVTNADGEFSLTVPDNIATLSFSYIGYLTREITINASEELDVQLTVDTKQLSEVVVTAFGLEREKRLWGM